MSNSLMKKNNWDGASEAYVGLFDPNTNLPVGEMLKYDARNLGGGGSGGSTKILFHTKILLTDKGVNSTPTPLSQDHFLTITTTIGNKNIVDDPSNMSSSDISESYKSSYWNIYVNGVLVSEKQVFAKVGELYAHLQTVVPNDGSNYTEDAYGVLFDEINNDIQPIYKIRGINNFQNVINNGSRKSNPSYIDFDNLGWVNKQAWINDVYNATTIDPGHTATTNDYMIFKTSGNYKKSFGAIHEKTANSFYINNDRYTYNASDGSISNIHSDHYTMNYTRSKYCVKDISSDNAWEFVDWSNIFNLNKHLLENQSSVLAIYVFEKTIGVDLHQLILLKPVSIDVIYLNYFDTTKYDLYRIEYSRDKFQKVKKIDKTILDKNEKSDVVRLFKTDYFDDNNVAQKIGRFGISTDFEYRFYLKDITTNQISPISTMAIDFSSSPKRNNVLNIRIKNN